MSGALFLSFMGSLVICMALIPVLTAPAWRFQFVDVPRDRHGHGAPIAKVGGLALAAGTFAAVLLGSPADPLVLSSLLGGAVILLFGLWDDRVGLNYQIKLAGQIAAAAIVVALAGVRITTAPFLDDALLPIWAAAPLALIAIVGMTNAVNLADGLDGLAGGLCLISFSGIAYLAHEADEALLVFLTVSVSGGLLGFLRFNTYPARVFMGDAGSQFLGHYLAVAGILLTDATRTPYSFLLALFLWGVPLLDTIGVMAQRLWEGRSPFKGDRNHFHYKLLALGLTYRQAVTLIYVIHGTMVACAYLLRWQSDAVLLSVYALFAVGVLSVFAWLAHKRVRAVGSTEQSSAASPPAGRSSRFRAWPLKALRVALPSYLVASVALPSDIPREAGGIAAGLLAIVVASLLSCRGVTWAVRAALYVGGTFSLYYSEVAARAATDGLLSAGDIGCAALAVLVALAMRWSGDDRFQTTPLDSLIVLLAVVMPFVPRLTLENVPVGMLTAKLIVLFFAFEVLLQERERAVVRLGWVAALMAGGLAVRAWWP